MEMLLISDQKLKITLTPSDMDEFCPDGDALDYADEETRALFRRLLRRAKEEVGFDTDGHRVLLQVFPSRRGGCEIFVTKMGPLPAADSEEPLLHYKPSCRSDGCRSGAFFFETLEPLLSVCRRLSHIGYGGESSVFLCDDRRYYLFLDHMDTSEFSPVDEFTFISEYGSVDDHRTARLFVGEHGRPICRQDAVEILGKL